MLSKTVILIVILFNTVLNTQAQTQNDISTQNIISPLFLCSGDSDSLQVLVTNTGANQVDSFMLVWSIDNMLDSTWVYTQLDTINGLNASTATISLTLVSMLFTDIEFSIWTKTPNGIADSDPSNDTVNYDLEALPRANINDTNLCSGTSVTFHSGVTNATYIWSNGVTDSTVTISLSSTISVTVTDFFGCISSDTAVITQSTLVDLPDSTFFCNGDSVELNANVSGLYLWNTGATNQIINVFISGNYSVTVTDQNCVSEDFIWVAEVTHPVALFSDSSDYMTVVFTNLSQNADSFLWEFKDGTTSSNMHPIHIYPWTPSSVECYDVELIAYNICGTDTFENIAYVGVYPFSGSVNFRHFVSGISVNFLFDSYSNLNPTDFHWDFGDGTTSNSASPTHVYAPSGAYECYTVNLQVEISCGIDYFSKKIAVGNYPSSNPCNIINNVIDLKDNTEVQIHPNPTSGILHIEITPQGNQQEFVFELYDILGKRVLVKTLYFSENIINVSHLAKGVYTYKIENVWGEIVKQF